MKAIPPLSPCSLQLPRRPKWEKQLLERYIVATTPGSKSLEIPILIQTTDTGTVLSTKGLLDCGATDLFVNSDFVQRNKLTTKKLSRPIPVYNMDGTLNEAGSISEVWDTVLQYHDHTECATFAVTGLGNQDIILGLTWLRKHNPEVNWQSGDVMMSRCLNHCHTCLNEVNAEQKISFMEAVSIRTCHAGPLPSPDSDMDIPDLVDDCEDDDEEPYVGEDTLKDGDRIFATTIPCKAEFVWATSNVRNNLPKCFTKTPSQSNLVSRSLPISMISKIFSQSGHLINYWIEKFGIMQLNLFQMGNL